jgi:hypothetical protein
VVSTKLARIRRKPDYYQNEAPAWVRNVWNRPESFNWFIKHRRAELVAAGAVVRLGRDYFVDAVVFPRVAARILGLSKEVEPNILASTTKPAGGGHG